MVLRRGFLLLKYIAKRLLMAIPVLFGIITLVFLVMHVFAKDPAAMMLGQSATIQRVAELRIFLGLDRPVGEQYIDFLVQIAHGDLGRSVFTKQPVMGELLQRLPATMELALIAVLISSVLGITIGIISAVKQYSFFDYTSMFLGLTGVSLPAFWLGLMLILSFSVNLGWLPVSGRIALQLIPTRITGMYILDSILTGNLPALRDALSHIILPAITIGIGSTAVVARMTRSAMLETIRQDYIRTANAKGLRRFTVVMKHALKNALIPVVTVIGMQLGGLMGGAVLTETIFSWPGVGSYIVAGINNSDYAVVQAGAIMMAAVFVIMNLVVDVLYAYLDPRIRYS
jgi:peptide/nickel transport system permease protein